MKCVRKSLLGYSFSTMEKASHFIFDYNFGYS